MLALNRYRLRHKANNGNKSAKRVSNLLSRPDRLIGVILIGNNLVNVIAAMIVSEISKELYGSLGMVIGSFLLTLTLLVFAEVTPKTIAAIHPERIAFPASFILSPLLKVLYPVVVAVNFMSNALVRIFGMDPTGKARADHLHPEELRTVVNEAGDLIPDQHQGMLLNVLDLEKATVEDIMVPRNEVAGIDLEHGIEAILDVIRNSEFTRLPVYEGDVNSVVGVLHLRNIARYLNHDKAITHDVIRQTMREPYFVPESTPLHTQLLNFKLEKRRFAIVVDEYGEVQGIVSLVDLLEEIVGEFSTETAQQIEQDIIQLDSDWYRLEASASVRDVNRCLSWHLSTEGPKTINGVIVEYLESIPEAVCSFQLGQYRFEITALSETRIEAANVMRVNELV